MASLPPRQTALGRRRYSQHNESSSTCDTAESSTIDYDHESPASTQSSDAVFLNHPPSLKSDSPLSAPHSSKQEDTRPNDQQSRIVEEPRKCWICYSDETEDLPHSSEWRSPCPCALTAHEACLLDWLAELENPRTRRQNQGNVRMQCPQCKSKIVISRPRSYIVDIVRVCERLAGKLVIPGVVFTFAGTIWAGCCAHGVYSMYLVFGTEEAHTIFDHGADDTWSPVRNVGIPFIPIVLIFSRMSWADGVLPAIPVLFFATHNPTGFEHQGTLWPPSATMTFAALPYVKSVYSALYERIFGKLERKWISEVQPRHGEDEEQGEQERGDQRAALGIGGNGGILMEIDLELQIGMDDDRQEQPANVPDRNNQDNAGQVGQDGQQNQQDHDQQILGRRRQELIHDTSSLADTVLGALLFPAISAGMGGLLRLALPKAWTTPPSVFERGRAGIFQSRWGRSVVGGCLFVLLKDALVLYCRWRLAQTHRKRRVLNYDREKKKVVR
jgi:FANCL C-terminal domain